MQESFRLDQDTYKTFKKQYEELFALKEIMLINRLLFNGVKIFDNR